MECSDEEPRPGNSCLSDILLVGRLWTRLAVIRLGPTVERIFFGRSINFRDDFQDLFFCTFDLLNV